ncbi:MAG TPA: hypothetical protein VFY93_05775 [Planctomycetota bacterium]|nr:hypothetical protein [Planctomycetota bacterium]
MRRASLLLPLALAACRHVPPDKEARAVAPPEPPRVALDAQGLLGAWTSVALRGTLADLGHTAVYVFDAGGRYTGALVSDAECTPIGGAYAFEAPNLSLDGGAIVFQARLLGDGRLVLEAPDTYVELVRFDRDMTHG